MSQTKPKDPRPQLLLTSTSKKKIGFKKSKNSILNRFNYYLGSLLSCKGEVCTRIEFSFYSNKLLNYEIYKKIIHKIFPSNANSLIEASK